MAILPKKRQDEIDSIINNRLMELGLEYPQNSVTDIANALNIKIFTNDSLPDNVRGIIKYNSPSEIVVSKSLLSNKPRMRFTIAHEIGHHMLHRELFNENEESFHVDVYNYNSDTKESLRETEANYFAASLLVPKNKLEKILNTSVSIKSISEYFGVSIVVVKNRIEWIKNNCFC